MFRRLCRFPVIMLAVIMIMAASAVSSYAKGWEPVRSDISSMTSVAREGEVELKVSPGWVVVSSSQQVQIKIFTILGQVVSRENLPAGVYRFSLSHGVYIVKVGDLTCKIAV